MSALKALPACQLGRNGPLVPRLGLGLMGLSGQYGYSGSEAERLKFLDEAYSRGQYFWDTADKYGDSEDILGQWFAANAEKRKDIFLATKFGIKYTDTAPGFTIDSSPEYCRISIESSLKRLGLPSVDLYYIHRLDKITPIEKTMEVMLLPTKAYSKGWCDKSEISARIIASSEAPRSNTAHPPPVNLTSNFLSFRNILPSASLAFDTVMPGGLQSVIDSSHGNSLPFEGDFRVDKNVLHKFPEDTTIISAFHFGKSAWTVTAQLCIKLPDASQEKYFLKSAPGKHGRILMEGQFNAITEIYKWAPDLVPKPHSWGKYAAPNPPAYFFLSQYIEMSDMMPDPIQLCKRLAHLHRKGQSPASEFGFHITTCQGRVPQSLSWEPSWTKFFINLLKHVIKMDFELNGYWEELDKVEQRLITHVMPRLLDALVKGGRTIKPSLIHADLWEGNTGTVFEKGNVYIFDPAVFYAHHEMEVGDWRCTYNKISHKVYTKTYFQYYEPSDPKDEWEDRNRLYSIYYNTIYSLNHLSQGKAVRQMTFSDMYYLIDKYAPFSTGEGPPKLDKSEMAFLSAERDHTAG